MSIQELYKTDIQLEQDEKGRFYLPNHLFCDAIDSEEILVNTPSIGVAVYKVHYNKDGSCWIKGDAIAKYWFDTFDRVPNRLFLNEEMIKRIND